jgi:hypothetical protein
MIEKSKYFQYLLPSSEDVVMERMNDFLWFDENGFICSVPKEEPIPLSRKEFLDQVAEWEEKYGLEKRCMITVVNPYVKSSKEERDFAAEIFPKYLKALAIINHSALGRMAINLFVGLRPPTFPMKVFKDSNEAKNWLKKYA